MVPQKISSSERLNSNKGDCSAAIEKLFRCKTVVSICLKTHFRSEKIALLPKL